MASSPFPTDKALNKPVCVFCGSSPGTDPVYTRAAESLGRALAVEHIPVVYGGGRRGIMGVVSRSTLEAGGYVHGILPRSLMQRASEHTPAPGSNGEIKSAEGTGRDLLEDNFDGRLSTEVVGSMHERKLKMAQLSTGGFVVLPGGYGTFEEMFEMITWNQLGIHNLPVIVLNIGGFYTALVELLHRAVEAGFIVAKNLNLLRVVHLDAGSDPDSWGQAALTALAEWQHDSGAGYGFEWGSTANVTTVQTKDGFGHFTTLRYTSPHFGGGEGSSAGTSLSLTRDQIPLLEKHMRRLRDTHKALNERDGGTWGPWVGDEAVWEALCQRLEEVECEAPGRDWRVRVVLTPGPKAKVSIDAQPFSAPPFQYAPSPDPAPSGALSSSSSSSSSSVLASSPLLAAPLSSLSSLSPPTSSILSSPSLPRRPMVLDPVGIPISSESKMLRDTRLYKTLNRKVYTNATSRGEALTGQTGVEVVVHTGEWVLEGTTSNIAVQMARQATEHPTGQKTGQTASQSTGQIAGQETDPGKQAPTTTEHQWVTPRLHATDRPLLAGVMRADLLERGIIRQGDLSVQDLLKARDEGRRIIGFNGLRGVWEAELL